MLTARGKGFLAILGSGLLIGGLALNHLRGGTLARTPPTEAAASDSAPDPGTALISRTPTDYDLAIDAQVEKFLEFKQKLTYFLITASVVAIAFLVAFFENNLRQGGNFTATTAELWLVISSCILGVLTAGFALLNLRFEISSYRLHIKTRSERKGWEDLSAAQQCRWNQINRRAAYFLAASFFSLFIQIALAVSFFIVFFE